MVVMILMILISMSSSPVHGFANYLVSRSNCYTELSTDEIIMNYPIKSYEETDDVDMKITLVEQETDASIVVFSNVNQIVTLQYPSTFPISIPLQVVTTNPNTNQDYQYAMDVTVLTTDNNNNKEEENQQQQVDVQFRKGACDKKHRITGRGGRDIVTLEIRKLIPNPSTTTVLRVVAGWAAGHEAVRLTKPLELHFQSPPPQQQPSIAEEEERKLDIQQAKRMMMDPQMKFPIQGIHQQLFDKRKEMLLNKINIDGKNINIQKNLERLVIHKEEENVNEDGDARSEIGKTRHHPKSLREFQVGFDSTSNEFATLTFSSYLQGAFLLILCPAIVVYLLLFIRRNALHAKGRLAL